MTSRSRLKCSPEKEDDEDNGEGVLFYTNKTGFPISTHVWDRMFDHAARIHPGGNDAVNVARFTKDLPSIPVPKPPNNTNNLMADQKVAQIQQYMIDLQYNHTGTQFFDIKKYRPLSSLNETAKEMIKEALPIKCLEAVILGINLTNGTPGLERYSMGFRTVFGNNTHRHVVLALSWNGIYGALGMSRRDDLMYKPLIFSSLADLVIDYIESYNQYHHKVNKVKIGYPISHDPHSHELIQWKGLNINPCKLTKAELRVHVDKHAKDIKLWLRQASLGNTYAPRMCPPPTYSKQKPTTSEQPSRNIAADVTASTTAAGSVQLDQSTNNPTKSSMDVVMNGKAFEMRI